VEEDFYSIVLYERLVLATPCNTGNPMQRHLVTSLAGPETGTTSAGKGMLPVWRRTPTKELYGRADTGGLDRAKVIVYFEPAHRQVGTLEDVSEKGIVVRSTRDETETSSGIRSHL
jgi:hypothetical protein